MNLPLDIIDEWRGTVSNPNASMSRSSGGQYSFSGRHGTNEFHDAAYWYFQNDDLGLDANILEAPPGDALSYLSWRGGAERGGGRKFAVYRLDIRQVRVEKCRVGRKRQRGEGSGLQSFSSLETTLAIASAARSGR